MLLAQPNKIYNSFRIPGLVLSSSGTLIGCYECRRGTGDDWDEIDLSIQRSTDDGISWTQTKLIFGNGNTLNNPMLTIYEDKILFMYCQNYKQLFICESIDDGLSFSAPREIKDVLNECRFFYNVVAIGPGHGIVKNGTILIPIWFAYNHECEKEHRPSFISTIYSEDGGISWHLGQNIGREILNNPSECALAIWQDQVLISIRNEDTIHQRAFAISKNGYTNWSPPAFYENMPDPICQGSMHYTSDAIYHINCNSDSQRVNLTVKISHDGLKTYEAILIDEFGGYADIAVANNIYVLYEKNYGRDGIFFLNINREVIST